MNATFLDLLLAEAPAEAFERPIAEARARGASTAEVEALQQAAVQALQVRATLAERRRRERELAALYETASDLSSIRDVERVLRAIVRRARRLLGTDTAYLTLIDEEAGDTYMRVTEGMVGDDFARLRLPLGVGLGGLVAQLVRPSFTANYLEDDRFDHTSRIDGAVVQEEIVAILGVPLVVQDQVIGVLFAADRSERNFTPDEVNLLSSLAAHAAIVIENTRLYQEATDAVAELNRANVVLQRHTEAVERAAAAHQRLTEVVLGGGGMPELAQALAEVLAGLVHVFDADGRSLARAGEPGAISSIDVDPVEAGRAAREAGGAIPLAASPRPGWIAPIVAGSDHLGSLALVGPPSLEGADRRTLERAAQVAALLLLGERTTAEAEHRTRGEFFDDLVRNAARDADALRRRGRLLGLDLDAPHAVAVADARDRRALVHLTREVAGTTGLVAERAGKVVLLTSDRGPSDVIDALRSGLPEGSVATVGAAGPAAGPAAVVDAYHEAHQVHGALLALGRRGHAATAADLGVYSLLFHAAGREQLARFVDRLLGPLVRYDTNRGTDLQGTLTVYFEEQGNITQVATRLHVHPNTVYQRLDRISQLVGHDVRDPAAALDLHLALRIEALRHVV